MYILRSENILLSQKKFLFQAAKGAAPYTPLAVNAIGLKSSSTWPACLPGKALRSRIFCAELILGLI